MFLEKGVLKICSKFTGNNHAEVWFQQSCYKEHLWAAASVLPPSTKSNSLATASQTFWTTFFLYEMYAFYHIHKDIFQRPLEPVRIRLQLKKCLFSWSYSYFVSTCCLEFFPFNFSSYLSKKYIFLLNRNVVSHIVRTAFVGFWV